MISLNYPGQITYFFNMMNQLLSFNLIDSSILDNTLFDFSDFSDIPYNDAYSFMGYESMNLIKNLGLIFYVSCLYFSFYVIL